jgi:hypothetical protein
LKVATKTVSFDTVIASETTTTNATVVYISVETFFDNKNVVFSYDRSSILSTLFPNKEITQVSVIKYDYINHDFILEYLELTNQSLQSEEPVAWAQILLIFLIILISSGLFIIVVFTFRHNSKKEIKTIKPYKVIKLEKKQLRKAKNK